MSIDAHNCRANEAPSDGAWSECAAEEGPIPCEAVDPESVDAHPLGTAVSINSGAAASGGGFIARVLPTYTPRAFPALMPSAFLC